MSKKTESGNGKGKKVEFDRCIHHYSTDENGKTIRTIEMKPNPRTKYKREPQGKGKPDIMVRIQE